MTGIQPTEDRLLMDMIKTNRRTEGETMTQKQYETHGKYNPWQAANRFGSWNEAKASAGIYKKQREKTRTSEKKILKDIKKVKEKTGGTPTVKDYRDHGKYSVSLVYKRFNSFTEAREKALPLDI